MIFTSIPIKLRIPAKCSLSYRDNIYAYAAILDAISNVDPGIGKQIHDAQRDKPITLGLILKKQGNPIIRMTVMADEGIELANILIKAFAINPELRIGSAKCVVETVDLNDPIWGGISTWDNFLSETATHLKFNFITPTAIMKDGPSNKRYSALLPDPRDVFAGLSRRWKRLGGPILPENLQDYIADGGCVISRHNLRTVGFRTPNRTQVGFIGRAHYELRPDQQDYAHTLSALAKFAGFSGVGYQTARGMGIVRTTIERRYNP